MRINMLSEGKSMSNKRFDKIYSQGTLTVTEIWVDKVTGVNYIYHKDGYGGGITPLLDGEGNVVVSSVLH